MNYVSLATVTEIVDHKQDIKEYTFELDQERKYLPGSFVQLSLAKVNASQIWPESRTFSIASYKKGILILIIKNVGSYTSQIFSELQIGSLCTIKYPFGNLFDKQNINDRHLLIAGGVGITPFLSLIDYFEKEGKLKNLSMLYSVKYYSDLINHQKLKVKLQGKIQIHITRESQDGFINRRICLEDIASLTESKVDHIYICGSRDFNQSLTRQLISNGYLNIHMDEWE